MHQHIDSLQHRKKYIKKYHKTKTYRTISNEHPQLIRHLLSDLLQVDGYTDVEIGFASGVQLGEIRKIILGDIKSLSRETFFDIFGLYARVFCDWFHYNGDE